MGQRTQLLVRLHNENGETKFSTILHYQWGFGRVMVMDALNLVIQFPFYLDLGIHNNAFGKGYEEAYYKWLGQKSDGRNYAGVIEDFEKYNVSKEFAYHATEDDLWKCDNNDGFMILDVFLGSLRVERSTISFFAYDLKKSHYALKQVSFEDYCKMSDSNSYTTSDFRKGWKLLAKNYGVELLEPKRLKEVVNS